MALLDPLRPAFRAVAVTVVPEAGALDEAGWRDLEAIVEDALAQRPPRLRRQLLLFIRVIERLPAVRGPRFSGLPPAARARFLSALERAPLLLVRRGFWGLRTLILMGYYARPAAAREIGYRAEARGWEARR
jgi:hypothetical protein